MEETKRNVPGASADIQSYLEFDDLVKLTSIPFFVVRKSMINLSVGSY